jgi:hypothetical protein
MIRYAGRRQASAWETVAAGNRAKKMGQESTTSYIASPMPRAEVKNPRIYSQPALGFYRLFVSVEVTLYPGAPGQFATLMLYGGELIVTGQGGTPHHVGRLEPAGLLLQLVARGDRVEDTATFAVELDQRRLQGIEDIRLGGELMFMPKLQVLYLWGKEASRYHTQLEPAQPLRANAVTWSDIRQQMGAGRTVVVEVREPDARNAPGLARAVRHWQSAWQRQFHADRVSSRHAIAECRPALQSLGLALGDSKDKALPKELREIFKLINDNKAGLDKAARFQLVRRALLALCNLAHHPEEGSDEIPWNREEAEFVVTSVAALLRLYERQAP